MKKGSRGRQAEAPKVRAFRELAGVFQKMEHTSSSTALVATLAEFLSKRSPNEARVVAYLLRGELAPAFESLEIGMAGISPMGASVSVCRSGMIRKVQERRLRVSRCHAGEQSHQSQYGVQVSGRITHWRCNFYPGVQRVY